MSLQQDPTYTGAPTTAAPVGEPPYGANPSEPPPVQRTMSVMAVLGLILAFFAPPVGFILSVIALFTTGARRKRGKGLAIAGIIVSLIVGTLIGIAVFKVGKTVSTLADPGCVTGKAAITDNAGKLNDSATVEAGLKATVDGLNASIAKSQHANVRAALKDVVDDYTKLQQAITTGTTPDAALQDKLTKDAETIDSLCTIGTK